MSVRIVQWVFIVLISKDMIICMLDTASKDPGQPLEPLEPLAESSYKSTCIYLCTCGTYKPVRV
jgi:hypothetical protein